MIIKIYLPYIDTIIDSVDCYLRFQHDSNLSDYRLSKNVEQHDNDTVQLLMFCYNLKNIKLVEETKKAEIALRIQYLQDRKKMLFDFLSEKNDEDLVIVIKNIQKEIADLVKAQQVYAPIDIEIDDSLHSILTKENLLI